jgi:predicted nucleotidyltransferase
MKNKRKIILLESVIKTLLYFKVRKINPTFLELSSSLFNVKNLNKINKKDYLLIYEILEELKIEKFITLNDGTYNILYQENISPLNKKKILNLKIKKVINFIVLLRFLPLVKFIGITGTIATGNPCKNSDVDLFVVVKKNRIF